MDHHLSLIIQKLVLIAITATTLLGCSNATNESTSISLEPTPSPIPSSENKSTPEQHDTQTELPNLVFQTGFEPESTVLTAFGTSAPCTDDIVGDDLSVSDKGNWEDDLEGGVFGRFLFCFGGGTPEQRGIEIIPEPGNPSNRVLRTWLAEPGEDVNDNDEIACNRSGTKGDRKARVQAVLKENPNLTGFTYTVRLKLGEGFQEIVDADSKIEWLTIAEFWNNAPAEPYPFRITLNLVKEAIAGAPLHFGIKSDMQFNGTADKTWHLVWPEGKITSIVAPLGQWITLFVTVLEGDATTGKVIVNATFEDGTQHQIVDLTGYTHSPEGTPDGFASLNPIKVYTSGELMCALNDLGVVLEVFWDDFAIGTANAGDQSS